MRQRRSDGKEALLGSARYSFVYRVYQESGSSHNQNNTIGHGLYQYDCVE